MGIPDLMTDSNLKFVLKEFPVLGEGSVEAAHVAVAARMQDATGKKYIEFHQKLLGGRGGADKWRALAVAKEVQFDMARIEKDMNSDEVKKTIDENLKLGQPQLPQMRTPAASSQQAGGRLPISIDFQLMKRRRRTGSEGFPFPPQAVSPASV